MEFGRQGLPQEMEHLSFRQGCFPAVNPQEMDPLTASLHDCAHRFIPHVKDDQCAASILYGGSYYTIVIAKQPAYPSYTPPSVKEVLQKMKDKSILGKRPCEEEEEHTFSYRRIGYDLTDNTLYPGLGHEFK